MIATVDIMIFGFWLPFCLLNIILAGFFAGMETGLYQLNGLLIELDAESGSSQASRLRSLLAKPNRLLTVLLTGTNIHHYISTFSISTIVFLLGANSSYAMLVATPVLFIFAESLPKYLYIRRNTSLVYKGSGLLLIADKIIYSCGLGFIVRLMGETMLRFAGQRPTPSSTMVSHRLATIIAEGHAGGALTILQANMANRLMSTPNIKLIDVMIPLNQVNKISTNQSYADFIHLVEQNHFSRLPIVDSTGQISGIVNIFDVLSDNQNRSPEQFSTKPFLLESNTKILDALIAMRDHPTPMSIVVNKAGQPEGIITMKDVIEEIVGELDEW